MDHRQSSATQKGQFQKEQGRSGTLYSLATNLEEHRISVYSPVSGSPREAAKRFWKMHQNPLAAGGYAGRFIRANARLSFRVHEKVKPQFEYHLEHHGHLRALEYDLRSAAETVLFEGWWYTFVNQQDIQRERLHRTPTVEFGNFQIVTFSALQQQIRALEYLGEHPDSPERFKAYVAFMEELKTRPWFPSRSDMRRDG